MAFPIIESDAISATITTRTAIGSYTASGAQCVVVGVRLSALVGTAQTISFAYEVNDGSFVYISGVTAIAKPLATDTTLIADSLFVVNLADGDVLTIYATSTVADAVTGFCNFYDGFASNVERWLGTAPATPTVPGVPEVDLTHVAGATLNVSALATNVGAIVGNTVAILIDTADMQLKLGTPAGASISADIAAIEAQTDDIGAAGAGLTDLGGMSTTMKQQVRDAMKLAPTAGSPTAGSVDKHLDDIQAKTDVISAAQSITVNGGSDSIEPIIREMRLYRNTDYHPDLNNVETFPQTTWTEATWASATGVFRYRQAGGVLTASGTVNLSQSGDTMTATVTLTDTQTDAMVADQAGHYEIDITNAGVTMTRRIATGVLKVRDRVS